MALPPALLSLWTALIAPFTDPASRTWWGALLASAAVAAVYGLWKRPGWTWAGARALLRHPSTRLDVQLLLGRQLLTLLRGASGLGGAWVLATALVRALDGHFGAPELSAPPAALLTAVYSLSLFVAWDLSRFWLHRLMHRWPVLWAFHQVHHSAERLSPLSFHRIHPVESALYQLRGALVTGLVSGLFFYLFRGAASDLTLLGVPALGLLLNLSTGNIRHSELWLPFPRVVEGWLLSPAQHQLHHSVEDAHLDCNYGTWLALWDRMGGSLIRADRPPRAFGLAEGTRNHGDDLISAWLGPVRAAGRLLLRRPGPGSWPPCCFCRPPGPPKPTTRRPRTTLARAWWSTPPMARPGWPGRPRSWTRPPWRPLNTTTSSGCSPRCRASPPGERTALGCGPISAFAAPIPTDRPRSP